MGKYYLRAFLCFLFISILSLLLQGLSVDNTIINVLSLLGIIALIAYPIIKVIKFIIKTSKEIDQIEEQFKKLENKNNE